MEMHNFREISYSLRFMDEEKLPVPINLLVKGKHTYSVSIHTVSENFKCNLDTQICISSSLVDVTSKECFCSCFKFI